MKLQLKMGQDEDFHPSTQLTTANLPHTPFYSLQDSSDPPLSRELYAFRTLRPKHLDIAHFFHVAPSVWNSLPREIRHIESTTAYETALKTHLL